MSLFSNGAISYIAPTCIYTCIFKKKISKFAKKWHFQLIRKYRVFTDTCIMSEISMKRAKIISDYVYTHEAWCIYKFLAFQEIAPRWLFFWHYRTMHIFDSQQFTYTTVTTLENHLNFYFMPAFEKLSLVLSLFKE